MLISGIRSAVTRRRAYTGVALAVAALAAGYVLATGYVLADDRDRGIAQSGEQRNMVRVGHADLQFRDAYQPNVIVYPNRRTIAFVGTHSGIQANPLNGGALEPNGTMIVDVTNPERPKQTFHIPVPVAGGQAQMARMCLGSQVPGGAPGRVYLMRNIQGNASQRSGYELWDVTNINAPAPVAALRGIRNTHKQWWECASGLAYMPGSRDVPAPNRWRQGQSMVIYDWSNPPAAAAPGSPIPEYTDYPRYIRTFGLVGAQPGGVGPVPPSLHGPISAFEHPQATQSLARAAGVTDVVGNRIYMSYGVGDDGVHQTLDRMKLLPAEYGGTWVGDPDRPTVVDLEAPQTTIFYMSPDQGGHTSFPVFGMAPASYANFTEFKVRDIVLLASESTANRCNEAPHWSFVLDVTVENSKTAPPGTRVQQNPWQGPMVLSTMWVDPRSGEKFPRGNYCLRGARYGVHSSEENFRNPFYGRVTFLAYFTGGVRAWDIREPQGPVEVAFYVPGLPLDPNDPDPDPDGYMTNNLEVDNRGFIYATDRNGFGLEILELRGKARRIALGLSGHDDDDDRDHDKR